MIPSLWEQACQKNNYQDAQLYVRGPDEPPFKQLWDVSIPRSQRKLFFVKVPKTASTSIYNSSWLKPHLVSVKAAMRALGHKNPNGFCTIEDVRTFLSSQIAMRANDPPRCERHAVPFTVVRNPFTWFRSLYTHSSHKKGGGFIRPGISFKAAVMMWCDMSISIDQIIAHPPYQDICRHLRGGFFDHLYRDDVCDVPIIIRFEQVDKGYRILLRELGIHDHSLQTRMKSRHPNLMFPWDREMIEAFEHFYYFELRKFGYTFDGPVDDSVFVDPSLV